jgi:hypothetical protein
MGLTNLGEPAQYCPIKPTGVSFAYSLRTNLEVGMNRFSSLPLALLLVSTFAVAQQPATLHRSANTSLTVPQTAGAGCPIEMEARHAMQTPVGMNAAGNDGSRQGPAINAPRAQAAPQLQRLRLTLTNPSPRDIVSAQFTAHGFSNKLRAMELSAGSNEPDLAKTIDLDLGVKGKGHASSDLSLNHFAAVTSIDLNSITYADGTTWRSPSPAACSITPSMVMLVAAN